jgi:hypothetical protein
MAIKSCILIDPSYKPTTILSSNTKTGCSINLPIAGHCRPTKNCSKTCYAKSGHTAMPSNKKKQVWVSNYLKGPDITQLIQECLSRTAVRLSGTGDILKEHVPNLLKLAKACPATQFWGMTRKLEIAKAINKKHPNLRLLVSVDSSSPKSVWNYNGALCFGPRLATDEVPKDKRIKTIFPHHKSGHIVNVKNMPKDKKDCPAVRHELPGCLSCGRCWTWTW